MPFDRCQPFHDRVNELQEQLHEDEQLLKDQLEQGDTQGANQTRQHMKMLRQALGPARLALQQCELKHLLILGVERTQAIQYWDTPEGQGSGTGLPNGIPLVANKPTALRVYLDYKGPGGQTSVTGSVNVSGAGGQATLQPVNGPVAAGSGGAIRRGEINNTLNFVIPASLCVGTLQCAISVTDSSNAEYTSISLNFVTTPSLKIHAVLVHYTGVNYYDQPVDATPTFQSLATCLDYVRRTYPISNWKLTGCQTLDWDKKLAVAENFFALHSVIQALRETSGSTDVYLALYPQEAGCDWVCGLGGGGTALTSDAWPTESAHEIGHVVGAPGDNDPDYPTYDGYPALSIGEYGFDVEQLTVYDPHTTYDFMPYAPGPYWVSPYTYLNLMSHMAATAWPSVLPARGPRTCRCTEPCETFYLGFRVHTRGERRVDVLQALHAHRLPPEPCPRCGKSDVLLDLLTEDGRMIGVQHCVAAQDHLEPGSPWCDYSAVFRMPPELRSIRVVQRGDVLADLKLAAQAPPVRITGTDRSERSERGEFLDVSWSGELRTEGPGSAGYAVRYSHDGGRTWRALATGLTNTRYVVNLNLLPGGEDCRLQVLATAGLRTSTAETEPFEVVRKPRRPYIVSPESGASFPYGTPVQFLGGGFSPDFGLSPTQEVVWESRALGMLGVGHHVTAYRLPVGHHRITMHTPDGLGGEAFASVEIDVKSP